MNRITIELTEDQAIMLRDLCTATRLHMKISNTPEVNAFLIRTQQKLQKSLAKAKTL